MIKAIGFVLGSAASAALLLALIGEPPKDAGINYPAAPEAPDVAPAAGATDEERRVETSVVTPDPAVDPIVSVATADEWVRPATLAEPPPAAPEPLQEESAVTQASLPAPPPPVTGAAAGLPQEPAPVSPPPGTTGQIAAVSWQPIWQPFLSEISARGFAHRLERLTGLDYRVTQVERGKFRVAFAYSTDDERANKVRLIEMATGLDLDEASS